MPYRDKAYLRLRHIFMYFAMTTPMAPTRTDPIFTLLFRRAAALLCTVFMLALAGCTHTPTDADISTSCERLLPTSRWTGPDPYDIARPSPSPIVRKLDLSDNGELMDRCQWTDILVEIRGGPSLASGKDRSKFVVFYVHGWKHNSAPADTDLSNFTALIAALSHAKRDSGQDVVGVFIGWPGASSPIPGLKNLTFWGRKSAADRAIAVANVTKLLGAAANIKRLRRDPKDFITAIGHSFGARILFSSVAPVLLHNQSMAHPGSEGIYDVFYGAANLTILLNPAFEASRFSAFNSNRRTEEQYNRAQEPTLLTISTSNDYPTKFAFPAGQILTGRWTERERTTLGNYDGYVTHRLERTGSPGRRDTDTRWFDHFCDTSMQGHGGEALCLTRTAPEKQPGNPFLVAKTDGAILDGHNGIWKDTFQTWLIKFIEETERAQARQAKP